MGLHKPKKNPNRARPHDELWWNAMDDTTLVIMRGVSHIKGWLLILDGKYIARSEDGTVRAEFDNIDEAKDFLWAIVNMERHDGV